LIGTIDDDSYIEEFRKLSTIVHANDTPIIMQIAHCGGFSSKAVTNADPIAPLSLVNRFMRQTTRKLSETGIEGIILRYQMD
jgi:2,4-dienoyl-CoA reductase-like NADH-dependent reductase (Old Yellow Enzyme family)